MEGQLYQFLPHTNFFWLYHCSILGCGGPQNTLQAFSLPVPFFFTTIIPLYIIYSLLRDNLAKGWISGFYFIL